MSIEINAHFFLLWGFLFTTRRGCRRLKSPLGGYVKLRYRSHPPRNGSHGKQMHEEETTALSKDADVTRLKVFLLSAEGDQETLRGEGEE